MKRLLKKTILAFALFISFYASAQEKWTDKVKFGINGGASFGQYYSFVNLSPTVAYIASDRFMTGVNIPLFYVSQTVFGKNLKSLNYGISPFARYFVSSNFFLHAELENLNVQTFNPFTLEKAGRRFYTTPLVGAGYFQRNANGGGAYFQALYILNYDSNNSYYNSPLLLRIGFLL